jgi:glutathione S-transferase
MLTVHHLGLSQSERIVWLCEELGTPYEFKRYDRMATGMGPPEYKALHPLGTAPIITDGDFAIAESGAIMEYIIAKHGGGRLSVEADQPQFADYLYWFHFANATFLPAEMGVIFHRMMGGSEESAGFIAERAERLWGLVETRLGEAPYFAGDIFTAADIIMAFPLTTGRMFAQHDLANYPNIRAYLHRIGQRPAYQRAMKRAEPQMEPLLK